MDYEKKMDLIEATEIALNKIQKHEPDHGSKIIGNILVQDHGDKEILRLAFASDKLIHSHLHNALTEFAKPSNSNIVDSDPVAATYNKPFFTPPFWEPQLALGSPNRVLGSSFGSFAYSNSMLDLQNKSRLLSLEADYESFYSDSPVGNISRSRVLSPRVSGFPFKTCHYFNKGYCKNGSECKFYHGTTIPESFSQMFVTNLNEFVNEEQIYSPRSLEKLELEITELLKSRRGNPVSIAALPLMYLEKYGKNLQAAGYLTESQRHGKAGYSLTKLLARLKNSVRLIDRPHGQHAIVLADDAPKYMEFRMERNDPGPIVSGSRQIYLTFPAESTFSEHDVAGYFSTYGPVEDVRIPGQPKRMFGFVSFMSSDTVKQVLGKGNPHFVCGARVLVKPYREKQKIVDRNYGERLESPMHYSSNYGVLDAEFSSSPTELETSMRMLRRKLLEEQEKSLSAERRHAGLQLARRLPSIHPFPKPRLASPTVQVDDFSYLLDDLNIDEPTNTNHDSNTQMVNLPHGPFASQASSTSPGT